MQLVSKLSSIVQVVVNKGRHKSYGSFNGNIIPFIIFFLCLIADIAHFLSFCRFNWCKNEMLNVQGLICLARY